MNRKTFAALTVVLCVIYAAFRIWRLTDACLWFDEIFSIHAAEMTWSAMFPFIGNDLIHPPFFYVLLKIWIGLTGDSVLAVRSFSVFFSLAALFPFFKLCRQLKLSDSATLFAFFLFAVNGSLIKYSQEVRMYSVLLFLSVLSLWLFARYLNVGKGIWFLAGVNILLVHTQYFGWFVVGSEVLILTILQRVKIGQMMIMFGITLASAIPWSVYVFSNSPLAADAAQNLGWAEKPGLVSLTLFLFNLTEPFYFQVSNADIFTIWQISIPILIVSLTAILLYLADWKTRSENDRNGFLFLSIMILLPIISAFAASWILPFSIWGSRHLIIVFVPAAILLSKCIFEVKLRKAGPAVAVLMIIFSGAAFVVKLRSQNETPIWCAWEQFANEIHIDDQPKTIVVFEDLVAYQTWFAVRKRNDLRVVKLEKVEGAREDSAYFLPRGFDEVQRKDGSNLDLNSFYIAFRGKTAEDLSFRDYLLDEKFKIEKISEFHTSGSQAFLLKAERTDP